MNKEILAIQDNISKSVLDADSKIVVSDYKRDVSFYKDVSDTILHKFKDMAIDFYFRKEQKRFHDSLTFFQKYFFKKDDTDFIRKTRIKAGLLNIGLSFGIEVIDEVLISNISNVMNRYNIPKMFKSLLFNLLFINGDKWENEKDGISLNAKLKLKGIMDRYNINRSGYKISKWIDESKISPEDTLPLPKYFQRDINKMTLYLQFLLKLCDTDELTDVESDVYKRAKNYATNSLGFTEDEFNIIVSDVLNNNVLLSSVHEISQFSIKEFLTDLIQEINYGEQRVNTLIELDPYRIKREMYKRNIRNIGASLGLGAMTLLTGGVGDFLIATTAPLLFSSFNDPKNPNIAEEIKNRFYEEIMYRKKEVEKQRAEQIKR